MDVEPRKWVSGSLKELPVLMTLLTLILCLHDRAVAAGYHHQHDGGERGAAHARDVLSHHSSH